MKNTLIFFIKDSSGFCWGVAPTKLDARIQAAWFLPKGKKYFIEPCVISKDKESVK